MDGNGINGENSDLKEYMLKEVDLIQNIIKRMASNSFFIKGWTITLVVATLLLKNDNGKVLKRTFETVMSVYDSQALDPHVNRERFRDEWFE